MLENKIQTIRNKVVEVLKNYFTEEAEEVLSEIKEVKKSVDISGDKGKIEELNVYEALMKFILFSVLPEESQLELFNSFLVKAFRISLDVKNRFALKMNLTPDIFWPETIQLFIEAMLKNKERLGTQPIIVQGEMEESPSILSNWLRDYNRIYGMDRHEKIIPHRYVTENQNVQKLNREDKIVLLRILEFYEGLKFPSQSQIQKALEDAFDQYAESEEYSGEEITSEEDYALKNIKGQLQSNGQFGGGVNDYISDDIENLIRKFPKVSDQIISKQSIRLLFNREWVKPTVSNWLADYRAYAGVDAHEINERSDYLMRSPNVQNLDVSERERLGLLLRSYDEKYMLPFSTLRQEISFNQIKHNL